MNKIIFLSLVMFLCLAPTINAHETIAYADTHGHADTGVVIDLVSEGVYVNASGFNTTHSKNFLVSGGGMVPNITGVYKIVSSSSWSSVGGGGEYGIQVMLDGQPPDQSGGNECHAHRIMSAGGDIGVTAIVCIITINAGQNITIAVRDEDSPVRDINVIAGSLTIVLLESLEDEGLTGIPHAFFQLSQALRGFVSLIPDLIIVAIFMLLIILVIMFRDTLGRIFKAIFDNIKLP